MSITADQRTATPISIYFYFDHDGDWEHVTIIVNSDGTIGVVWFSAHEGGQWTVPEMQDTHPVVYVALGSHGSYPTAGQQHRSDPYPDDETGEGTRVMPPVIETGERRDPRPGQEWIRYAGLWGELGRTKRSSAPYGPGHHPSWRAGV